MNGNAFRQFAQNVLVAKKQTTEGDTCRDEGRSAVKLEPLNPPLQNKRLVSQKVSQISNHKFEEFSHRPWFDPFSGCFRNGPFWRSWHRSLRCGNVHDQDEADSQICFEKINCRTVSPWPWKEGKAGQGKAKTSETSETSASQQKKTPETFQVQKVKSKFGRESTSHSEGVKRGGVVVPKVEGTRCASPAFKGKRTTLWSLPTVLLTRAK
ncbi:hypothetical protein RUM44_009385 [Polyplax serrata]|uniref:Uncharacterized protein n=1 Tax=Polyplax serrata TaxID=468196 RepID=A0ABR1ASJ4_POLSC